MYWETLLLLTPLLVVALLGLAMIVGCTGKGSCNLMKANHPVGHQTGAKASRSSRRTFA
jgi:hypothetical protein